MLSGTEHGPAPGTRPEGVNPADAAAHVRGMFDQIAPSYDRANHLLSLSIDRYWRWRAVRLVREALQHGHLDEAARILDICCGTGDFSLALAAGIPRSHLVGADFSHVMLAAAQRKAPQLSWLQADALHLPHGDASFAAITAGFGFRNLTDYRAGLRELRRCLLPGGVLAILEVSRPVTPVLKQLYPFYFERVLPLVGGWISGQRAAYRYLPASVSRFPSPPTLVAWMKEAGFREARFQRFSGGIAALHLALK